MSETKARTLRLDEELDKTLRLEAAEEGISVHAHIVGILSHHVTYGALKAGFPSEPMFRNREVKREDGTVEVIPEILPLEAVSVTPLDAAGPTPEDLEQALLANKSIPAGSGGVVVIPRLGETKAGSPPLDATGVPLDSVKVKEEDAIELMVDSDPVTESWARTAVEAIRPHVQQRFIEAHEAGETKAVVVCTCGPGERAKGKHNRHCPLALKKT